MISTSELLNHTSEKTQCEKEIPYRVEQMLNKLNSKHQGFTHNYPMMGNNQQSPMMGNNQQSPMMGNNQQSPMMGNNQQSPMMGNNQHSPMMGNNQQNSMMENNQQSPMMGNNQQNLMMGNNQQSPMMGNGLVNNRFLLNKYKNENEQIYINSSGGKMDEITKLLDDFIKKNNLSIEEQKYFYNELTKINKKLPANKKVVISFEKNKFKIQVSDSKMEQIDEIKSSYKNQNQYQESSQEVSTYNFGTNIWYITLSSVVLTILIIVLLLINWKDNK